MTMPGTLKCVKEISNNFSNSKDASRMQYCDRIREHVSNCELPLPMNGSITAEEQSNCQRTFENITTFLRKRILPVYFSRDEDLSARNASNQADSTQDYNEADNTNCGVEGRSTPSPSPCKVSESCHHLWAPPLQQPRFTSQESGTLMSGGFLLRSNSAPCKISSSITDPPLGGNANRLSKSVTEKWKCYESADSNKVCKLAPEKLSDKKKKKPRCFSAIQSSAMLQSSSPGSIMAQNLAHSMTFKKNETANVYNYEAISPLQIVMLIVGTRGDVQPFIAIGKHLQDFGHRVRLATHSNFRQFVLDCGLEYYPLGGDPKVLAGYMVRNRGLFPTAPSEISISWVQIKDILDSLLPACTESDGEHGAPFRAEAIIANPPAYGQVHVAEALKIPIHIFFTMPWTPTSEFPHPLSWVWNPAGYRLSYQMVDLLMWLGSHGLINEFRRKKLKLSPVTYLGGGSSLSRYSSLPTGYIWSQHLIPKPKDWGPLVDVVGFCFLDLASTFKPPTALTDWLRSGTSPIYFGFGSLPLEDPKGMTEIIIQALQQTHQRGIIDKGWGGMGSLTLQFDFVYLIENCPHDWLFPQCTAVVHHGGAGTTAAGLRAACPTTIVPFFGDQLFWGERVHSQGIGPAPIPIGHLSVEKLVAAIQFMLEPEVKTRACALGECIKQEDGVIGAVNAFHKHLSNNMSQLQVLPGSSTPFNHFLKLMRRMCCC